MVTDEFPQLCVGVRDCSKDKLPNSQQLKFDIIELNGAPISVPGGREAAALYTKRCSKLQLKLTAFICLQTVEHLEPCR